MTKAVTVKASFESTPGYETSFEAFANAIAILRDHRSMVLFRRSTASKPVAKRARSAAW